MTIHELTRADARRIAVRAQLLDAHRPDDLAEVVRGLTLLVYDPTAAVAPAADLVVWSRLGSEYDPSSLATALAEQKLVELRGVIRPIEDVALHRAEMAAWDEPAPGEPAWRDRLREWVHDNDGFRLDLLERLRADGPLRSRDLPDTSVRPWRSTGWTNSRNVRQMLELLVQRGEVALHGRENGDPLWDLAARVYPDDVVPVAEAVRLRDERRLRSLGLVRPGVLESPAGPVGEPAVVDGVRGSWRVDPAQLGRPFDGRAALLSPFDRLVHDRKRMAELFEFDYQLEMFKPAAQRRWGYFALPVLYGDRLVGKVDATADRRAGVLRVDAVHEDAAFTPAMAEAVDREIDDLATWLRLVLVRR
ncbi:DNA glycosylase AlkZ-like family protein [Jiangella endophytica]|uniref:DNA glycosylase AlkZ-like family protein n=1 Tax=Jiangella endophytica TaxID=1623398 RepID=UPI0018E5642D|nr:crosslink repair DNA glycosylase YcaQ family protein [Jiangella endophytica]